MKQSYLLLAFFFFTLTTEAQQSVKKYVMLEHFTNSKCSICASKNPAFYALINQAQYLDDVHHVSIHPSVPYNTCVFYLANPTENNNRASLYGIQGTPQVAINGKPPVSLSSFSAATLQAELNQTSPLYLQVEENDIAGGQRHVSIKARTVGDIPAGNYKIYAAVVEKTINMTTPNTETVHHDVFRKMLPDINGATFNPAAIGETLEFNYNFDLNPNWIAGEIYVVAFVQNITTEAVLNSGTKFDAIVLDAKDIADNKLLKIFPNPAQESATITLAGDQADQLDIFAMNGQRVISQSLFQQETVFVSTAAFAPGIYFVKVTGEKGTYTTKLVKQ